MSSINDPASLINQLPISIEFPREDERFFETLNLLYKRIANAVNTKTGSLFTLNERLNFEQYYTLNDPQIFRNVYRLTFDMVALNGGPIAPGATVSFPHNITLPSPTSLFNGTAIYGSATNSDALPHGPKRMPLPYASVTAVTKNIEIYLDDLNVVLVNGSTQTALTYAVITAEYLKN